MAFDRHVVTIDFSETVDSESDESDESEIDENEDNMESEPTKGRVTSL